MPRVLTEDNRRNDTVVSADDVDGNLGYVGYAAPGTATSSAGWAIVKVTYSAASNPTKKWANGSPAYVHIWDNRATYTYS